MVLCGESFYGAPPPHFFFNPVAGFDPSSYDTGRISSNAVSLEAPTPSFDRPVHTIVKKTCGDLLLISTITRVGQP